MTARRSSRSLNWRRIIMFPLSFVLLGVAWEGYKTVGPAKGGKVFGWQLLPKTGDREMPHILDMVRRLAHPEVRGGKDSIAVVVLRAMTYSLWLSILAVVLGVAIGVSLAVVMSRFRIVERALTPYLIVSQTIPIVALAPLVVGILAYVSRELGAQKWIAAVALGSFLAFFPMAMGALRGLKAAEPASVELMDSYAAGWWTTLFKLRFPASVSYLAPALRLAGASSVVGVVVSEISIGLQPGVGRLILSYSQEATTDPPKLFTAVFGAGALGLMMAGLVLAVEKMMMRNRPLESAA